MRLGARVPNRGVGLSIEPEEMGAQTPLKEVTNRDSNVTATSPRLHSVMPHWSVWCSRPGRYAHVPDTPWDCHICLHWGGFRGQCM